jgi:hypothetical protein
MYLHSTSLAPIEAALLRDFHQIQWMYIPKVPLHHPTIPQVSLASWIRARLGARVGHLIYRIQDWWAYFEQLFGYHCLLVDVMDIHQVAAKRCLQHLPALPAFNAVRVSLQSHHPSTLHPSVRLR